MSGVGAVIPLQPSVKTMVRPAIPLWSMKVKSEADIHQQLVEDPMPEQMDAQRKM